MLKSPFQTLQMTVARLLQATRRRTTREETRRALAILGPALRDDIGLTRHRQFITFQNARHKEHSFD